MLRLNTEERPHWRDLAKKFGFGFHTAYGEPYWDETAYYQFTLKQIEDDLEKPTEDIHQMCLEVVDTVVGNEYWLRKFQIPEPMWQDLYDSWQKREPSLYSRVDFAYNGTQPAKLYENNADTPTSLYETAFWQWLWLEDMVNQGKIRRDADQCNLLQELLISRFQQLATYQPGQTLHLCCCKDSVEDRGTVQYLEDCAREAGLSTTFVYVEDIGLNTQGQFTDLTDKPIHWIFKLYPWEFMFREEYAANIQTASVNWLEPMWKSIISNKALLPLLWKMFPNHPNLLPAYFADDRDLSTLKDYVIKPIFAREGANITIVQNGRQTLRTEGPYGDEGVIYQAYHPLPKFGQHYTLVGSWLINQEAAGISIREDVSRVTQDMSRYVPHIIID
ncbi:glutathionylspermidine synthase family protein [Vibrio gazogenes]|uniref:Glutathionylspermidine synthase n=1 Tax=Vibrio gazogenes DSM 21264 = NBRC 103151 TaxID=1123492 RepID=A0A1M5ARY7_VIBGA|nr:glutathionylspermidine synthase family protein [Vibrio gazogenes]USP12691.1 glutathionylspermidine synthase family protein [Vibrio gazogenes]SHF33028.1 Glutathionylspermidine synthase [Vibrio gazogenes DSM 21264] [Vibrio gazogenes DSM 21264 = NBRC 103151]SJN58668.1 Putative acid--amine ligase YgiC [Vibrio gazogenes]